VSTAIQAQQKAVRVLSPRVVARRQRTTSVGAEELAVSSDCGDACLGFDPNDDGCHRECDEPE
jgi:hypothetical protein